MNHWLMPAVCATVCWAVSNCIDAHISRSERLSSGLFVVLTSLWAGVAGLALVATSPNLTLQVADWPSVVLVSVAGLLAYLPYYQALKRDRAERVVLYWNVAPLITCVLAFLVLGEQLSVTSIVGVGLLCGSVALAALDNGVSASPVAVCLMVVAALFASVEAVARRSLLSYVPFLEGFAAVSMVGGVLGLLALLVFPALRRELATRRLADLRLVVLTLVFDLAAAVLVFRASSLGPAGPISAIGGVQPILVALLLNRSLRSKSSGRERTRVLPLVAASAVAMVGLLLVGE